MRDMISDLVNLLTSDTESIDLGKTTNIFKPYMNLFDSNPEPPADLFEHWKQLVNIYTLLKEFRQEQQQIFNSKPVRMNLNSLKALQIEIKNLNSDITQKQEEINQDYRPLIDDYNLYIQNANHNAALYPNSGSLFTMQEPVLGEYLALLASQLDKLEEKEVTLHYSEALREYDHLHAKLSSAMGLNYPITSLNFAIMSNEIFNKITILQQTITDFSTAQRDLAENLSIADIEQIITQLHMHIERANEEFQALTVQILDFPLDEEKKQTLNNDYSNAEDRDGFIRSKEQNNQWASSSYNLTAWGQWLINSSFNTTLEMNRLQVKYLNLLQQRGNKSLELDELKRQLNHNDMLVKSTPKSSKVTTDALAARHFAIQLLSIVNPSKPWDQDANSNLLTALIENLNPLHEQVEHQNGILNLLDELRQWDGKINALRFDHQITIPTDEFRLNPDVQAQLRSDCQMKPDLIEKHEKCHSCLNKIAELKIKNKQLAEMIENKKELIREKKKIIEIERQSIPQSSNSNPEGELIRCIHQLQNLFVVKSESQKRLSVFFTKQFDRYNQQIIQSIKPTVLSRWYGELINKLITGNLDENACKQGCQLLRDIQFELEQVNFDFSVLRQYQRICPEPGQSIDQLLALKPAIFLEDQQLAPVKNRRLGTLLLALNQQHGRLQNNYPKEAELLRQAIYNLHSMALVAENNPKDSTLANISNCMRDPRYEPLTRHRGFLKVCQWLAELSSSIFSLFQREQARNYRQSLFFKPTRTEQLLQTATTEVFSSSITIQ